MKFFFQAHRTFASSIAVLLAGVLGQLVRTVNLGPHNPGDLTFPVLLAVPALQGALIVTLAASALATREGQSVRLLSPYIASIIAIPFLVALIADCWNLPVVNTSFGVIALTRNVVGFTGISLLALSAIGSVGAWLIPFLWLALPPFFFSNREDDPIGIITFYAQLQSQLSSSIFALAVFALGLTFFLAGGWIGHRRRRSGQNHEGAG